MEEIKQKIAAEARKCFTGAMSFAEAEHIGFFKGAMWMLQIAIIVSKKPGSNMADTFVNDVKYVIEQTNK